MHWDFECDRCGAVVDIAFSNHQTMKATVVRCVDVLGPEGCDGVMRVLPCAPALGEVRGFNARNHYGAKQMVTTTRSKEGFKVVTTEHSESSEPTGNKTEV